jgi:hypothetical protein
LLGLLANLADGGGMFLWKTDWFSLGYTALYPKK